MEGVGLARNRFELNNSRQSLCLGRDFHPKLARVSSLRLLDQLDRDANVDASSHSAGDLGVARMEDAGAGANSVILLRFLRNSRPNRVCLT